MTLSALGIFSAAGAGGVVPSAFELIETQILGSAQASVTFSNLGNFSSIYKHLQIRAVVRGGRNDNPSFLGVRFNGDSGTNYLNHSLQGNGSAVSSSAELSRTNSVVAAVTGTTGTTNAYGAFVYDILDAYNTSKNTTGRSLSGLADSANLIRLGSTLWLNTASLTSIEIVNLFSVNISAGSRFSLYGIR